MSAHMAPCRAQGPQRDCDGCIRRQAYHQRIVSCLDRWELRQGSDLPGYRKDAGSVEEGQRRGGEGGTKTMRKVWDDYGDLVDEDEDYPCQVGSKDLKETPARKERFRYRKWMRKSVPQGPRYQDSSSSRYRRIVTHWWRWTAYPMPISRVKIVCLKSNDNVETRKAI